MFDFLTLKKLAFDLEDETMAEHLETILEIVQHLWSKLSLEERKKFPHYVRAIGKANWALMQFKNKK